MREVGAEEKATEAAEMTGAATMGLRSEVGSAGLVVAEVTVAVVAAAPEVMGAEWALVPAATMQGWVAVVTVATVRGLAMVTKLMRVMLLRKLRQRAEVR